MEKYIIQFSKHLSEYYGAEIVRVFAVGVVRGSGKVEIHFVDTPGIKCCLEYDKEQAQEWIDSAQSNKDGCAWTTKEVVNLVIDMHHKN